MKMFSNKNIKQNNKFLKILNLLFSLTFKSEKNWILSIVVPLVIVLISSYSYTYYSKDYYLLPPQILSISLIPSYFVGIYFSIILSEWKKTFILKRVKFVGIKPWQILTSMLIICIIFSAISTLTSIFGMYIISLKNNDFIFSNLSNLYVWNYIWFCLSILLITSFVFLLFTAIMNISFKEMKWINIIICILIAILMLICSDSIIMTYISSRLKVLTYIGYIVPTKYMAWITMLTSSFTFIDSKGIQQLIFDVSYTETTIFIKNIYLCIIVSTLSTILLFILNIFNFKWKD